ncbi:MAG: FxSxx-COOH system tetratricopeptide repeat protein [Methanothrix sp.]
MKDFFISYNKADRQWAEWIAWQLEEAGYTVVVQCWDFLPGCNFILEMHDAAKSAEQTIGVISPDFLSSVFTQPEWAAAIVSDPTSEKRTLLPIRVKKCQPDGLLAAIVFIDLVDLDEENARKELLDGVGGRRLKPKSSPSFPCSNSARAGPRFPGVLPSIWNLPHMRNPNFTGREKMLSDLYVGLNSGQQLQALTGLGGKGKTSLAKEYAYRYMANYDHVWWIRADEPATLSIDYANLAVALDLPQKNSSDQTAVMNAVKSWLGQNQKCLLVFDNAQEPEVLKKFLPQAGSCHVIITSRNPNWRKIAAVSPVEVFKLEEAVEFIHWRTGRDDLDAANALAKETGRLPLALEQAGAYIEETGISLSDYLDRFRQSRVEILKRGKPVDYDETVATTWQISFQAVREKSPAGADLLILSSFLDPDNIHRTLIASGARYYSEPLATTAVDDFKLDDAIAELRRYSLIEGNSDGFFMHQLVQAVTRDRLAEEEKRKWSEIALEIVNDCFRFEPDYIQTWEETKRLLPHAIAVTKYADELAISSDSIGRLSSSMGLYLQKLAYFEQAKFMSLRVLRIAEKKYGSNNSMVALAANNLGGILKELGEFKASEQNYRRALKIAEDTYGPCHPNVASISNNLGRLLHDLGDYRGAKEQIERALMINKRVFGPKSPQTAPQLNNLGGVLRELGDLEGAQKNFKLALEIDERIFGPNDPKIAIRLSNLGGVLRDMGKFENAKINFERALEIDQKIFGSEHPDVGTDLNNLGMILRDFGDLEDAEDLIKRALEIHEKAFGKDHPSVAIDLSDLGDVLRDLGETTRARNCFQRSFEIMNKILGTNHPNTLKIKEKLVAIDIYTLLNTNMAINNYSNQRNHAP